MKKESDPSMIAIVAGSRVWSRDGEEVGTVAEVTPGHFRVDVRAHRDFWLSKRIVAAADTDAVQLDYDEAQLDPFKLDGPEASAGSPIADAQTESFEDASDQQQRREDMRAGAAFDKGEGRDT